MLDSRQLDKIILESEDAREFLARVFLESKKINKKFSHNFFRVKFGLKSRGHFSEILQGKKRITLSTANKISFSLKMSSLANQLFLAMIEDTPASFRIEKLRHKIEVRLARSNFKIDVDHIDFEWPKVFASLTDPMDGSTLRQLCKRTQFSETKVHKIIDQLLEVRLVEKKNERYFSTQNHVVLHNLFAKVFKDYFRSEASHLARVKDEDFKDKEKLFLISTFSLNSKNAQSLKENLRSRITELVDEYESPTGDSTMNLLVGLR